MNGLVVCYCRCRWRCATTRAFRWRQGPKYRRARAATSGQQRARAATGNNKQKQCHICRSYAQRCSPPPCFSRSSCKSNASSAFAFVSVSDKRRAARRPWSGGGARAVNTARRLPPHCTRSLHPHHRVASRPALVPLYHYYYYFSSSLRLALLVLLGSEPCMPSAP